MKKLLLIPLTLMLMACSGDTVNSNISYTTRCIYGVMYIGNNGGYSPMFNRDGEFLTCSNGQVDNEVFP